jgi:sseB protein
MEIKNTELVKLIKEIKKGNEDKYPKFWEEVFKAKFICPVKATEGDAQSLAVITVGNSEGEHFMMAFTDFDEFGKWSKKQKEEELQISILPFNGYKDIIGRRDSTYRGLVINPFGENMVLGKEIFDDIIKEEYTIKEEDTVVLKEAEDCPEEMIKELCAYMEENTKIDKAYLLWLAENEGGNYMLIVDTKESPKDLFPKLGDVCVKFLPKRNLGVLLASSDFGKRAIVGKKAFYER